MATNAPRTARADGLLLAAGAIISIQLGAALSEALFDRVGAAGSVFLRLLFAAALLSAIARPRPGRCALGDVRAVTLLGAFTAAQSLLFFEAMDRIPFGVAVTLQFLGPLGVALAGSRRALDVVWVAVVGLGVALLCAGDGPAAAFDAVGVGLAGVSAVCWAGYIVLTKHIGTRWSGLDGLAMSLAVAAALAAPAGIAAGGLELLAPDVLVVAAALSVLIPLLPYVCELAALRRLPSALFGLIMSFEPAVAVVVGFVLLGQALTPTTMLGVLLVLCASAGAIAGSEQPAPRRRRRSGLRPSGPSALRQVRTDEMVDSTAPTAV